MALLWIDGFETYGTTVATSINTYLQRRYTGTLGGTNYIGAGRLGGYALYGSSTSAYVSTPSLTMDDTLTVGLGVKLVTGLASDTSFLQLYDSTTLGIDVKWLYASGELGVYRNTTLLGTTSGAGMTSGGWYYVEIKIKCSASTGTVDVRVGGVSKLSLTAQNTKNGTDSFHNVVRLKGTSSVWLDDVYVLDSTGSTNNTFLGNRKVVALRPTSDGSVAWTPSTAGAHATLVDENPDNDDTDYVESSTVGQVDLYDYNDASQIGTISGIMIGTICRLTDANDFRLITEVVSNGVTSDDGTGQTVGSTTYVHRRRIVELNPDGNVPWMLSALNAAQIGVKVG